MGIRSEFNTLVEALDGLLDTVGDVELILAKN